MSNVITYYLQLHDNCSLIYLRLQSAEMLTRRCDATYNALNKHPVFVFLHHFKVTAEKFALKSFLIHSKMLSTSVELMFF